MELSNGESVAISDQILCKSFSMSLVMKCQRVFQMWICEQNRLHPTHVKGGKKPPACLMFWICNAIFTLGLRILNRAPLMPGNLERENHTYNLIPEGMNSRGTNKQENKIFLHLHNSEKKATCRFHRVQGLCRSSCRWCHRNSIKSSDP